MKQSKPSIFSSIKNVVILVLIVSSMILHSFIDATTNSYSNYNALLFGQIHTTHQTAHDNSKTFHNTKPSNQKISLRFNKRFHFPSFVIPSAVFLNENNSDNFVEQHKIGQPTAYLLFSVILAQSLRGPPLAA